MAQCIGVISDTHGLLREEVVGRLRDCERIFHAGDVGSEAVLAELRRLGEVFAVRGNVDHGRWARQLRQVEQIDVEGKRICIVHNINTLDPISAGADVVIYGHSHEPAITQDHGILYLNPGSAGPKRFHRPVSMALLHITTEGCSPEILTL